MQRIPAVVERVYGSRIKIRLWSGNEQKSANVVHENLIVEDEEKDL